MKNSWNEHRVCVVFDENSIRHTPLCGNTNASAWNIETPSNSPRCRRRYWLDELKLSPLCMANHLQFPSGDAHALTGWDVWHYPMAGQLITRTDTLAADVPSPNWRNVLSTAYHRFGSLSRKTSFSAFVYLLFFFGVDVDPIPSFGDRDATRQRHLSDVISSNDWTHESPKT